MDGQHCPGYWYAAIQLRAEKLLELADWKRQPCDNRARNGRRQRGR